MRRVGWGLLVQVLPMGGRPITNPAPPQPALLLLLRRPLLLVLLRLV